MPAVHTVTEAADSPLPVGEWPHREHSRFVSAAGMGWHLQEFGAGAGPTILLVHGTGAASHSFAGLAPLLADNFHVLVPDLPGHGRSDLPTASGMTLPGMASGLQQLLQALQVTPALVVGHSAGAAILARMSLSGAIHPAALVSINGAMLPLSGLSGRVFPPAARLLASLPGIPQMFARHATQQYVVERLIRQTGSRLSDEEVQRYRSLVQTPKHVTAALTMMANWDLHVLAENLPQLRPQLLLWACTNDKAVPVAQARGVQKLVPGAELRMVPGLGHLGHEENPALFERMIRQLAERLDLSKHLN